MAWILLCGLQTFWSHLKPMPMHSIRTCTYNAGGWVADTSLATVFVKVLQRSSHSQKFGNLSSLVPGQIKKQAKGFTLAAAVIQALPGNGSPLSSKLLDKWVCPRQSHLGRFRTPATRRDKTQASYVLHPRCWFQGRWSKGSQRERNHLRPVFA